MKTIFFQKSKKYILIKFVKNLFYVFDMTFANIVIINQDIIQIYNNKNIKFFNENFINKI